MATRSLAADVVIVGAGAAGLSAAKALAQRGIRSLVLEARDRLFGRVHTVRPREWPCPVEHGAEFLHDATPLSMGLARHAKLPLETVPQKHAIVENGRARVKSDFEGALGTLLAFEKRRRDDRSVAAVLAEQPPRRRALAGAARMFVEGYHAADTERASARALAAEEEGGNDTQRRVLQGYDLLLHALLDSLPGDLVSVETEVAVRVVRWRRGRVTIEAREVGRERPVVVQARAALVTVPIGVLRAGDIVFEPQPSSWSEALTRLEVGFVEKLVLLFHEAVWPNRHPNFWHRPGESFPTWWTTAPRALPVLTAWTGGPKAHELSSLPESAVLDRALGTLSRMLGRSQRAPESALQDWERHDWTHDPWSQGAYAYIGVGGLAAQKALSRLVEGTLLLAGEALEPGRVGTVEGALASGARAGRALARELTRGTRANVRAAVARRSTTSDRPRSRRSRRR